MPSFEHKQILKNIELITDPPNDPALFPSWLTARQHIDLLLANGVEDEVIIYGSSPQFFVHSVLMPTDKLENAAEADLLCWSCNATESIASYVSGGLTNDVWIERSHSEFDSSALGARKKLVFLRSFSGWPKAEANYFEVN